MKNGSVATITYNTAEQRATDTVVLSGTTQLSEIFTYRGGELAQTAYSGTSITTPYTDTFLDRQDGAPYELLRQTGSTTSRYWYSLNGHGDVVALTDTSGNVVDRYHYDSWGVPTVDLETVKQPLLYAGYWYDRELSAPNETTGWYWLATRPYDPVLRRFLQPDPSQQEGARSYVYAGDDPLDGTDPSGLVVVHPPGSCSAQQLAHKPNHCPNAAGGIDIGAIAVGAVLVVAVVAVAVYDLISEGDAGDEDVPPPPDPIPPTAREPSAPRVSHFDPSGLPKTTEESVIDKLNRYILNPEHAGGGATKAKWFRQALGYTRANLHDLAKQIVFRRADAIETGATDYGTKYNQLIDIVGANGKVIPVKFAWILNPDGVVRLVTAIPTDL